MKESEFNELFITTNQAKGKIMSILSKLLMAISMVPVSIISLTYGWGLEADNWVWVAFGYAYAFFVPIFFARYYVSVDEKRNIR